MRIVCIIQARLGSTRLPGKVLMPLGGKSMLQNIVERLRRCTKIDELVIAWPFNDFPEASKHKFDAEQYFYSGDENDLVGRFLNVAKEYKADWIVRVCSDNPVVEAEEIDALIIHGETLDFKHQWLIMNSENVQYDFDGFGGELYSIPMLNETTTREHPHKYWIDNHLFTYFGKSYPNHFRLDVNTQADYEKLADIYDHFGHNQFSAREALQYLEQARMEKRHISP